VTDSRTTSSLPPELVSVAASLPPAIDQSEVAAFTASLYPGRAGARAAEVFDHTGIEQRHLARPLDWYGDAQPPAVRFRIASDLALEHGSFAARQAMARAGVSPHDIDTLVFASTTVLRSPNLDVSLASTLGLRSDVRRLPLFGLASLGGAAALATAADLARGPDRVVLVIATEMNSLTFVPGDDSMEGIVTMALFSDGAAAAVVRTGDDENGARVRLVGHHSTLVPDSLDAMGFDPTDEGLRWRLAPDVPDLALKWTRASVEAALDEAGWQANDLDHVLVHPGGAKVLDAVEQALDWGPERLEWSRRIMSEHGNVSSVTVLLVLDAFLASSPAPGRGLLTAMGPGFGFEHVLFTVGAGFARAEQPPVA
jgi:alkylresorcinol/alkylpyrone synthase